VNPGPAAASFVYYLPADLEPTEITTSDERLFKIASKEAGNVTLTVNGTDVVLSTTQDGDWYRTAPIILSGTAGTSGLYDDIYIFYLGELTDPWLLEVEAAQGANVAKSYAVEYPVFPASGGTKKIKYKPKENQTVKIVIADTDNKVGAIMVVKHDDDEIPPDGNGEVPLTKDLEYEITLTGGNKPGDKTWEQALVKDNVHLEFRKGGAIFRKVKLTVFWVVLDVDPDWIHPDPPVEGQPADKYDWPEAPTNGDDEPLRDYAEDMSGHYRGGRFIDDDWSWGAILVRGKILPGGMKPSKFIRNSSKEKGFDWRRLCWERAYIGNVGDFVENGSTTDRLNKGEPNDNGEWDEEPPGAVVNADEDLTADKDGPGDYLYIYSFDLPGFGVGGGLLKSGDILRARVNFMEFVYYNDELCSDGKPTDSINKPGYKWYLTHSAKSQPAEGGGLKFVDDGTYNNNGDNVVGADSWLAKWSHNLTADTPAVPFNVENFGVDEEGSREKRELEVILKSGDPTRNMLIVGQDFPDNAPAISLDQIKGDTTTVGVDNKARESETELSATFDFEGHGTSKPGEYRIKVTIAGKSVVLLKKLVVIGRVTTWEFREKLRMNVNEYWIFFNGFDDLGHIARGTDAPPVAITETAVAPEAGFFTWSGDTQQIQTDSGEYIGRFYRELTLTQSGTAKFIIDDNEEGNPTTPYTTPDAKAFTYEE